MEAKEHHGACWLEWNQKTNKQTKNKKKLTYDENSENPNVEKS